MLIAQLIGGAILLASFSLRMPQVSSALSLFFTTFKSTIPVPPIQRDKDISLIPPTLVDSPSFCANVISFPSPAATNLVVHHHPSRYPDLGFTASVNRSADLIIQEVGLEVYFLVLNGDEGDPVFNPAACPNILLLLAPLCGVLVLYLIYVSHLRKHSSTQF